MTSSKQLVYTFTTIADTTDFATFEFSPTGVPIATAPAINDRGQVAFWGVDSSLEAGIFVGDGSLLKPIADTSGEFSFLGVGPAINDRGTVAFLAGLDSGDAGYFTGNGKTTTLIADSSGRFNFQRIPTLDNLFGEPVINDRGRVAFRADLDRGGKGIFLNTNDRIRTIAAPRSGLTTFGITPDINSRGTVVFLAGTVPVPGSIEVEGQTIPIAELFQNAGIFTTRGNNLRTIADTSDGFALFSSSPAINDRGTVAFVAVRPSGEAEVVTGRGGRLTSIANSRGDFRSFGGVDINDEGTVAYLADFDAGGSGLFVRGQEIISTGDQLLGSAVTDLNFLNKGFNDDSVAFWAELADGRSGVFRADLALQIEVLATGLDGPRKLSFDADGALHVAEAGRGGTGASIPSPSVPGAVLSYGATGAITRIQDGVVERIVTGLPSLALPDGSDAAGVNDIDFDRDGNAYAIVGFASNPANRGSIIQVPDFSHLIGIDRFDGGSSWTRLSDFGAYEQNNNPDGQDVVTNLYDLLIEDNTAYVIDAGANTLLSQRAFGGEPTLETVFPSRSATDPFTGESVVQQSVPTAITVGSDGAFYVSELTGYPLQAGAAQIYRLNAQGQPEVYAGGFTNVVDLAFDKSGGLYVLEYDADRILSGSDAGALIYVSPNGQTRTTITDDLIAPTGLAIGSDGDIYISNNGFIAGQGEVLRISVEEDFPFTPDPLYEQVEHYTTTIDPDGDSADIYFPALPDSSCHTTEFPVALMLQGALVDKADYSSFASQVASYGFVVVVPNNERTISAPNGQSFTGLFADQGQVNDVLVEMKAEDVDASSPLFKIVDTSKMGLLGHSFGGAVGLGATQDEICQPGLCSPDYTIPPELKAGIFYGTNFRDQQTGESLPIDNEDIAIGLILGSLDGVALPSNTQVTYDQILNPPKALITVEGANHYGITNADNLLREPSRPTLDQATAIGTIARWSGLFLRANLLDDRAAFDAVFNTNLDPSVSIISQP